MKKILILSLLLLVTCYLLLVVSVDAATPTPFDKTQEIKDQLITNIASRVAQLKLVEKRGIVGTVTEVSNTQITILDIQTNIRFIDVDELTKFSSPLVKTSFGISDITKGTRLGVLGLYNKESRRLLARFVNVLDQPMFIHGIVDSIDNKNYTLDITTVEKRKITVDVGTSTKILFYTKDAGLTRLGFSKIKENEDIIVIGFTDIKNKDLPAGRQDKITASRVILFPEVPSLETSPKETISPSSGSRTITPISNIK